MRLIDRFIEAKAIGDLLICWIAQHGFAATNHDRNVRNADVETIEQMLNIIVAVKIDIGMRMTVAGQKFFDAQRLGRITRADEDDVADSMRDELDTSKNERAHDNVAQLAVGLQQIEQLFPFELDYFTGFARANACQSAPAGEQIHFASKLARLKRGDERLARAQYAEDVDLARRNKEEPHLSSHFLQDFAGLKLTLASMRGDARNLCSR